MIKRQLKLLIRKFDAVQVDQIWMKLGSFNFAESEGVVLRLEPLGSGVASREFTWEQLLKARVENTDELVLKNGTRMKFFKLQPIKLLDEKSRLHVRRDSASVGSPKSS